jgi:hypothetical protein
MVSGSSEFVVLLAGISMIPVLENDIIVLNRERYNILRLSEEDVVQSRDHFISTFFKGGLLCVENGFV